ncbi:Uncharacterized protein FWK35_00034083 [Aphis craccivora]|uniref:Uncharacterized protein n=1 Tax=Aphis craccivora TaxID=307492 RepID=A0A6G0VXV1_APHCR|nr:Uncharacterized protein FWK35_00034083 [Aphis craccivora]
MPCLHLHQQNLRWMKMAKKNHRKYSIKDSQDHFMIVGESVEVFMDQLKNQGRPIQPFIFIVSSIFRKKKILVHSILRAVELEYPFQSQIHDKPYHKLA